MTINLIIGTYSYKLPHSKECGKGMHLANYSFKNNEIRTLKIINEIKNPSYFQFSNKHSNERDSFSALAVGGRLL